MAHYDNQQAPVVYPPPAVTAYPPPPPQSYPQPQSAEGYGYGHGQGRYVTAPPPLGYPTKDDSGYPQHQYPVENKSRGDGFWKGCLAALCCCCVLDTCFC